MTDATAFLIVYAAKASVLLAVAAVIVRLCRRSPAATRHWVWLAAIVAVLALPVAMISAPTLAVRIAGAPRHPVVQAFLLPASPRAPTTPTTRAPSAASERAPQTVTEPPPSMPAPGGSIAAAANPVVRGAAGSDSHGRWPIAFGLWAFGVALFGTRLALDVLRARRLRRDARLVTSPEVSTLLRNLAGEGRAARVRVWASPHVATPVTSGVFVRDILLPTDYHRWSDADRRAVLAHEVAHAVRADCIAQLLAHAMCAIHWFNPLAWIAARALRAEAERACDDRALNTGAAALAYADLLVRFARQPTTRAQTRLALPMASAGRELERRLEAIVDPVVPRDGIPAHARIRVAMIAVATLAVAGGARLEASPEVNSAGVERPIAPLAQPSAGRSAPRSRVDGSPRQTATRVVGADLQVGSAAARAPDAGVPDARRATPGDTLADPRSERIPFSDATMTAARAAVATLGGPDSALAHVLFLSLDQAPKHDGDLVRERAAWALVHARGARLVEPLIDALGSSDWREAAYAAWAFSHAPDVRTLSPLIALLDHGAWRARAIAATALRGLADDRAAHAMRGALNDEAWQVRAEVVEYFAALGDAISLDAIRVLADDPHIAVRNAVQSALSSRGGR